MENMIDSRKISVWIEQKEPTSGKDQTLLALNEAWGQTASETDTFLQSSQQLKKAFSELVEKYAAQVSRD